VGWDPQTGMWEPDVTRQPLGALGSVMQFMNARRARDISGQLDQERQDAIAQHAAQLEQEQFQLQEARSQAARDQQLREKLAAMPEGATPEQMAGAYIRGGGEAAKVLPFWRTQESGAARVNIAKLKNAGPIYQTFLKSAGNDPAAAKVLAVKAGFTPDEADILAMQGPLAKPAAEVENIQAGTELKGTQAEDIEATRQSRIDLAKARADTARILAGVKAKRAAGGDLGPKEKAGILAKVRSYRSDIERLESKRDPMTMKLGAVDQQNLRDMKADLADLEGLLHTEAAPTKPVVSPPGSSAKPTKGVGSLNLNLPPPPS
jgi:hypothetical protein